MAEAALALGLAHRQLNYCATTGHRPGHGDCRARAEDARAGMPRRPEILRAHPGKEYPRRAGGSGSAAGSAARARARALDAGKVLAPGVGPGGAHGGASRAGSCCGNRRWSAAGAPRRRRLAAAGIRALRQLDRDFRRYWPLRNKGTTAKCSTFLRWRTEDYRRGIVFYPPEKARLFEPEYSS